MNPILTPYFPASEEEILAFLNRARNQSEDDRQRVIRSANHALAYAEARTRRRLVGRTYRTAVSVDSCTVTGASKAVTGAGFSDGAKAFDDVVGVGLSPGSRVASVTSDAALTLDRAAEESGTVTLTFGSEPLVVDGEGGSRARCPEYPLQEVYSISALDSDGNAEALDITGIRITAATGAIYLPNDSFPCGTLNIVIECLAGYLEPTATVRGNFTEWQAVQRLCLRLMQIYFEDETKQRGRIVDSSLGNVSAQIPDFRLPADVRELIAQFERLW